jgi:hypothetical protein
VPLDRPPRSPTGAVTERVRRAILSSARERLAFDAPELLALHVEAEYVADTRDLLADVERRYKLESSLQTRVMLRMTGGLIGALTGRSAKPLDVYTDAGAEFILLELPDPEFVTAIQNAVDLGFTKELIGGIENVRSTNQIYARGEDFISHADQTFAAHGAPYRRIVDTWRFEWIGDPTQHELVIQPALQALDDSRLGGARAEFEEALHKRRLGAAKDLEDAVDEAAKAVESLLKVLHAAHNVTPPHGQQVTPLFNSLVTANVLPGYVDKLVVGAAGPRNQMASHGQGATVRAVPEELADASIAAAATAITLLTHYLP